MLYNTGLWTMTLAALCSIILDESSSGDSLERALNEFTQQCSRAGGVLPDVSFSAWAGDTFLDNGVAINPGAAAHCVKDYQRTIVFLRGINAAIHSAISRFPNTPIRILYAGCGPFATLLFPLLPNFEKSALDIHLVDIHQRSLDSAVAVAKHFGLSDHRVQTTRADASNYRHADRFHLIIAETMQKSLEQEPQYAVTANLAPQLIAGGIFIPEKIEVELRLAPVGLEQVVLGRTGASDAEALSAGQAGQLPITPLLVLSPEMFVVSSSPDEPHRSKVSATEHRLQFEIPASSHLHELEAFTFTRVQVFSHYWLTDNAAAITLPRRCDELSPLVAGARFEVSYETGSYPRFNFAPIPEQNNVN